MSYFYIKLVDLNIILVKFIILIKFPKLLRSITRQLFSSRDVRAPIRSRSLRTRRNREMI